MFYEPKKRDHGLPHDPMKALVAPRPIGWISSLAEDGTANLAPYSFFNLVAAPPPIVAFSSYPRKDSVSNIEATGEFVCNIATGAQVEAVNQSSAPVESSVDEFDMIGVEKEPSRLVHAPRVRTAPAHLECRYISTVNLTDAQGQETDWFIILGEVVGVHIDDQLITVEGRVDTKSLNPLSRLGYLDYGLLGDIFERPRPKGLGM